MALQTKFMVLQIMKKNAKDILELNLVDELVDLETLKKFLM